MSPSSSLRWVRALNCLQNSMMLICAWPSAGPTGGAGVALPAAICSFTEPVAFFAMCLSSALSPESRIFGSVNLRLFVSSQATNCCLMLTFSTCPNSSSTGVERPKMVTITFSVSRSSFTSSTMPVKVANGPSVIAHGLVLLELDLEFRLVLASRHAINDVIHFFFGTAASAAGRCPRTR